MNSFPAGIPQPHPRPSQRVDAAAVGSFTLSSRLRRLHFIQRASRMKKFRLPLGAGSEPELIEIDDARESIGDFICNDSPNGQHEFSDHDGHRRCIHCREVIQ